MKDIMKQLSGLSESAVASFLRMMVEKRLMFEEKGRYLSLAVPVDGKLTSSH